MSDIPEDAPKYNRIVQQWHLRMMRSSSWLDPQRTTWVRCFKFYRQIIDAVPDPDEPNVTLGYIVGLINQITAKVTEPVMGLRPPCPVSPKILGDHKAAKNFEQIARNWYSQPNMREPLRRSKKMMVITGTRFEIDEWANTQRDGKIWGKKPKTVEVDAVKPDGKPLLDKDDKPVKGKAIIQVDAEKSVKIPIHYGFHTRYPSVFDCYPEPDRPTIGTGQPTDCSWFVEDMGELSLEELARQTYVDAFGRSQPLYDFEKLLHDAGNRAKERYDKVMAGGEIEDNYARLITPTKWTLDADQRQEDKDTVHPTEGTVDRQASEDRDKIWAVGCFQRDEYTIIANGKYIIRRKRDPWHYPEMPVRVEQLFLDPTFIHGMGIIEPIEDELNLRNDIRNMAMSQLIRIINKLVLISQERLVSENDFKLGAGGKIRVQGDGPVQQAAMELQQTSSTNEMLALDSELRGEIEFVTGNLDGSPGIKGTKQDHKTKGGLEMISESLSLIYQTIMSQSMENECRRMQSMQRFFDQHAFEKMPYQLLREDGGQAYALFNREDIYTAGRGFNYSIEIDPSFGNVQVQRQDAIDLFNSGLKYEEMRLKFKDPRMKKLDLSELYEDLLHKYGRKDTSGIFMLEGNIKDPGVELEMIMQGATDVECTGDLIHHATVHLAQRNSPAFKQAIEKGKAHPDAQKYLDLLISQCMAKITTFMKDPMAAVQAQIGKSVQGPIQ